jgi:hypothetical protein
MSILFLAFQSLVQLVIRYSICYFWQSMARSFFDILNLKIVGSLRAFFPEKSLKYILVL